MTVEVEAQQPIQQSESLNEQKVDKVCVALVGLSTAFVGVGLLLFLFSFRFQFLELMFFSFVTTLVATGLVCFHGKTRPTPILTFMCLMTGMAINLTLIALISNASYIRYTQSCETRISFEEISDCRRGKAAIQNTFSCICLLIGQALLISVGIYKIRKFNRNAEPQDMQKVSKILYIVVTIILVFTQLVCIVAVWFSLWFLLLEFIMIPASIVFCVASMMTARSQNPKTITIAIIAYPLFNCAWLILVVLLIFWGVWSDNAF